MRVIHQHDFHGAPLGWNSSMNLFSLMFALLLALAFLVLMMLYFDLMPRKTPPAERHVLSQVLQSVQARHMHV
jgi:hypothetical protein